VDEVGGITLGQNIARLRGLRHMTQTGLAAAAGVSVDLVRKLEQSQRHTASMPSLQRLARALDVDAAELLPRAAVLPAGGPESGAVAIRHALTTVDDLIGDEPDVEPLTLVDARRSASFGWGAYWAGNYAQLGVMLPTAIAQVLAAVRDATTAERAQTSELAAIVHQLAACTLVHLGYMDVAHLALRNALRLAGDGDDELLPAALRCSMAWLLLNQGRCVESHRVATATAAEIAPAGDSPLPAWSIYGSLLLNGANAAGRSGDRPLAGVLLGEASEAAGRTGSRNDYESAFGPDQVLMQTVDVEIVTENYDAAITTAQNMPANSALPAAARARHLSDVALAHTRLGHDGAALDALLRMEQIAPAWTRFQVQPREIVRELRERAAPPLLAELAERMGVRA
jgi:transcriptional regulator with XRE-family HTH domain